MSDRSYGGRITGRVFANLYDEEQDAKQTVRMKKFLVRAYKVLIGEIKPLRGEQLFTFEARDAELKTQIAKLEKERRFLREDYDNAEEIIAELEAEIEEMGGRSKREAKKKRVTDKIDSLQQKIRQIEQELLDKHLNVEELLQY